MNRDFPSSPLPPLIPSAPIQTGEAGMTKKPKTTKHGRVKKNGGFDAADSSQAEARTPHKPRHGHFTSPTATKLASCYASLRLPYPPLADSYLRGARQIWNDEGDLLRSIREIQSPPLAWDAPICIVSSSRHPKSRPIWRRPVSGRLTNGHLSITRGVSFS